MDLNPLIAAFKASPPPDAGPDPSSLSMAGIPALPNAPALPVAHINQLMTDQGTRNALVNSPAGVDQIQNPLLHGLAKIADGIGHFALPGLAAAIPGTTDHHNYLVGRLDQRIAQDQQQQLATNAIANTGAEARIHTAQADQIENPAQAPLEYDYVDGPGGKYALLKGTTNATPVTLPTGRQLGSKSEPPKSPLELALRDNPNMTAAQWDTLQQHPVSEQEANTLNATWNPILSKHGLPTDQIKAGQPRAEVTAATNAFNQSVGRQQGDTHITIQQAAANNANQRNAPLDTSDPDMQANIAGVANGSLKLGDVFGRQATTQQKAAFVAAVKNVNPTYNSGDHDIENALRRDMTSGHDSNTLNAVNTAYKHLDTFATAARSLNNGDVKGLNQLANTLGVQFQAGASPQVISGLVKEALKGEVARALTGAGATVDEQRNIDSSFSNANSLSTMLAVANTAKTLLKGKSDTLQEKYNSGLKAQPNFTGSTETKPTTGKTWNPVVGRYE